MFKKRRSKKQDDINDENILNEETELEYESDYKNEFGEDFEDEFFEDDDDLFEKQKDAQAAIKKKDFYVKKEDLIAEIQKYNDSKKSSPNGRGIISEELRTDDYEDLHAFLYAPEILSDIAIEMNSSPMQ